MLNHSNPKPKFSSDASGVIVSGDWLDGDQRLMKNQKPCRIKMKQQRRLAPVPALGVVSTIFNLGIPLASWCATQGNTGAGNVVKLMAALTVILTPFIFLSFLSPGKPVPRWREWSSHISDGATVAILTWNGWMWCALAFTFGWIGAAILFGVKRAATTPNAPHKPCGTDDSQMK